MEAAMTTGVKSRPRRLIVRSILAGLSAILILGLVAPLISASRLTGRIQKALDLSLGRKVHFTSVHLTLFSGPGFSLDDVTIDEDPRYGLEPFAHVTTLKARLRIDKLLAGRMIFSSLRLIDPSLNLVKRSDGTWNVVELVQRLSAPRRAPLNLFPAMEVSGARIDFKFGTRKTTLYIADTDLAIYPERSGKVYIQFSGWPARTDRAGNGFGHLRGSASWYLSPGEQLQADVTLDPSNLSEMATLFRGHDIGVHGTVSSHARIEGPATALRISGELRVEDVHRWDLLPSSGEDWRIRYRGGVDLLAHTLDLETTPWRKGDATPVTLQMRVIDFLTRPTWSVSARLDSAPIQDLLPISRRMGLVIPENLAMKGVLAGDVGYSNNTGLSGAVAINNVEATLPNLPSLSAELVKMSISAERVHFEPAIIQTSAGGTLQAGGDYYLSTRHVTASLNADQFPVHALKSTADAWFGSPAALALLEDGNITGQLTYQHEGASPETWSGQFQFADCDLKPPGIAIPLTHSEGHVAFDNSTLELTRFSGTLGQQVIHGNYRYNALAKRPERIRLELPSADLTQIEAALDPTLRAQDLLARLRVTRRIIPPWLASRNLEGDLSIGQFSVNGANLGPLSAHFTWQGASLQFGAIQLTLPAGQIGAHGTVNLASYTPRYRFEAKVIGFAWRGGLLNAEGQFETYGTGAE
ncbi:MAG: AsmA family protein, partial [Bryobacteraceae bacterium]